MGGDPVADALRVDLEVGGDAAARGGALVVGLAYERGRGRLVHRGEARRMRGDQGAPLVGRRLRQVAALDRREQAVGALDVVRRRPDGRAEAGLVDHGAGEVEDGARLAPPVPELVLVVPVHDLVDDGEGRAVAGLRRQHDARRERGGHLLDGDLEAALVPAAKGLVLGQEELLEREHRLGAAQIELGRVADRLVLRFDRRDAGAQAGRGGQGRRRLAGIHRHGRDHVRARAQQVGGKRAQVGLADEVALGRDSARVRGVRHLMNSCSSSRR